MADIVNPQAVKFANDAVRPFADVLLSAIESAREFEAQYAANAGDTLFPNTADLIADGSETDGRFRVQAQTVRALRTAAQDLLTWAATGSPTRETRLRTVAVNAGSRV
jgi:hypothetical protein